MTISTDKTTQTALCHHCRHLQGKEHSHCIHCGAHLEQRHAHSLIFTFFYTLTALLLIIPANLTPMMIVSTLGSSSGSTIMGGVIYFLDEGDYALAAIIFIASIAVPFFKLAVLFFLLWISFFKQTALAPLGTKLFKIIHAIGKWSMLDVFVVGLIVSMVQFGELTTIAAGPAAISFCLAVVFTIIASNTFDPRILWDTQGETNHDQ
jgi:paraquat-inducible protein A